MHAPAPPPPHPPSPADVSVVILTHNGTPHLPACLTACLALDGLHGPAAVCVADNGSSDGALGLVARDFPAVTRLRLGANLGFAACYNAAAAAGAIEQPWLLLLNDDTAIAIDALQALCDALGPGDVCAGARLVDWAEARIDFDGGAASWTGHGHPLGHGRRIDRWTMGAGRPAARRAPIGPRVDWHTDARAADAQPTLFACGGGMLVHRATFLALGGFDPSYYMYYEDVDFGWRLTLAGHDVRHVPGAVVRHRGGGSAAAHPLADRARWHARNALANVVKNTADDHLARVLSAALALEAVRGGAPLGVIDAAAASLTAEGVAIGHDAAAPLDRGVPLPLPPADWPGWPSLAALELDWPALAAARAAVRPLWRRAPAEVIARLGLPWAPVPPTRDGWAAQRRAADVFELEGVFGAIDAHTGLRGRLRGALRRVGRQGAASPGGAPSRPHRPPGSPT